MDPDETLSLARAAAKNLMDSLEQEEEFVLNYSSRHESVEDAATELVERFQALDAWLSKGGFLPAAWAKGRK